MFGEEPAKMMGGGVFWQLPAPWLMTELMIFLLLLTCQFLSETFSVNGHGGVESL